MRHARRLVTRFFRRRVDRLLEQAAHGWVNESELLRTEQLARVIALSEQHRSPQLRLLLIISFLAGLILLTIKQNSVDVFITMHARGGTIELPTADQIPIHLSGERIHLSDAVLTSAPMSIRKLLTTEPSGDLTIEAVRDGSISVGRVEFAARTGLAFRSDANGVELQVSCSRDCDDHRIVLTLFGPVRTSSASDSLEVPTGIEFRPRRQQATLYVSHVDTAVAAIQGPLAIYKMSPQVPRFVGGSAVPSVTAMSSIIGGAITFGQYGKKSRGLMPGDELQLAGDLHLESIEIHSKMMLFTISGSATTLTLGGEDLRPTVWDWVRIRPVWQLLVAFAGAFGGYVMLFNSLRNEVT